MGIKDTNNVELVKELPSQSELNDYFWFDTERNQLCTFMDDKQGIFKIKKVNGTQYLTNGKPDYSKVYFNGKQYLLHRIVYTMYYGDIPEGMVVDHIDDDKTNNRPENLQLLTQSENSHKRSRFNKMYFVVTKNYNKFYLLYKNSHVKGISFSSKQEAIDYVNNNTLEKIIENNLNKTLDNQ